MDLLFAMMVSWYLFVVTSPDILKKRITAFYCGLIGGFAYLSHHYGMPFFIIHFPLTLLLMWFFSRRLNGTSIKTVLYTIVPGFIGLLIIVSTWIGVLSVKYGRLTISNKASIAHSVMGPPGVSGGFPFFKGGLYKPRDHYAIHVFEDPSGVEFKRWSPFENKEYLIHQLKLIKLNATYILDHFVKNSPFFTYAFVICILLLIPISILLNPVDNKRRAFYTWVVLTFITYSSGYLLIIARSPRRFYTLMIIFLFISLHIVEEFLDGIKRLLSEERLRLLRYYLMVIVICAFAVKPGLNLLKSLRDIITIEQVNPYSEIAEVINTVLFPSPYAIIRTSQKPHTDLYIAYYLKKQFLGRPLSRDVEGITRELIEAGARSLLVFDNTEIVQSLRNDGRYLHIASLLLRNPDRYTHAVNIEQDEIKAWDKEVNIFVLR